MRAGIVARFFPISRDEYRKAANLLAALVKGRTA